MFFYLFTYFEKQLQNVEKKLYAVNSLTFKNEDEWHHSHVNLFV